MAASSFSIMFPPGDPDWAMALRRVECLDQEQILSAASLVLEMWEDEDSSFEPIQDLSARHFLLQELDSFSEFYDSDPQSEGVSFQPIPEGYTGYRDPLRTSATLLSILGVIQSAGFTVQADFAPFAAWPQGETDPGFGLAAAS